MTKKDGSPLEGEAFAITTADGKTFNGMTYSEGVGSVTGIKQDNYKMEFPNMDKDMWGPQGSASIGNISNRSSGSNQRFKGSLPTFKVDNKPRH